MRLPTAFALFPAIALSAFGQTPSTISGEVLDADDRAPIAGATVELVEVGEGMVTAADGSFRFPAARAGDHTLRVRFIGYEPKERVVTAPEEHLVILLRPTAVEIGEVIVTGSPLGSTVRYQPVQAFSRDELERRSASSFGEMLDGSPGIAMRSFGPAPARPVIRGFDGDRVVVLENGERPGDLSETAADHALALDPLAADRVEIVRGPASLLYGSGAIGGVVNVLTDDIPLQWDPGAHGEAAVQSSTVNRQGAAFARVRFGTGTASIGGRFAARGAGDVRTPEGRLPDTDLRNFDGGVGGSFRTGGFSGGAMLSGLHRRYGLPESIDDANERVEIRMQRQALHAQGRWEGSGAVVDAVELRLHLGRYAHDEVETIDDQEDLDLTFDQRVASATLLARHGALGRGAVGLSLFARDLLVGGDDALTPDGRATRLAAFVFEEVDLSAVVTMQAAVRAEAELLSVRPNELFPEADDRGRSLTLSSALGLNIRPGGGWEIGFQVAQAYRSPTIEERYSDSPHVGAGAYEIGNPDLGREQALGLDGFARFGRGRLTAEVAAFAIRIADFVVYQPTGETHAPSGLPIYVYEADDAMQLGGEVATSLDLGGGLRVRAAGDYVRGTRLSTSEPLPRIPPLRGTVEARLEKPTWFAGGRLRAIAPQRRTAQNEEATGGYILTGLEGGLRLGPAQRHILTLRMDNLLDIAYRDHLSRVEARHAPMPGRNLNLTYRVMW